jgi:hypothetical protein
MNPNPTSLDSLHDIVAPPPAPWWPPAPAWNWVIALLAIIALVFALRLFSRWMRNRYRREALAELARRETELAQESRRAVAIAGIAELLKRTALTAFPREKVASLNGPEWFAFLNLTGRTVGFNSSAAESLERVCYNPAAAAGLCDEDLRQIARLARHWIRKHRVDAEGKQPC